eukprot:SAG11_NODE_1101_length_5868_cov_2.045935_11_plen_91_part_00
MEEGTVLSCDHTRSTHVHRSAGAVTIMRCENLQMLKVRPILLRKSAKIDFFLVKSFAVSPRLYSVTTAAHVAGMLTKSATFHSAQLLERR